MDFGSSKRSSSVYKALALTLFVFALLVWVYVVAVQLTHPIWLYEPFSHVEVPPFNWRVDEVGMMAFAVSAFGFFFWRLEKEDEQGI